MHDEHCARLRETVESEMLTYVLLFLVSIISPLLGLAEPICIFGATLNPNAWIWIALVVAAGQTTGFSLLYFFGDVILGWMPKLKKKLDEFDLGRFRKSKFVLTGCAGMFGMPPATLLAGAGALFEARAIRFLAILFAGRLIRFLVIAGAPTLFLSFFDVNPSEVLPDWVKGIFPAP